MKQLGHCALCDTPVFEITHTYPDGTASELGAALPAAHRALLAMRDGTTASITFCEAHARPEPEAYPRLHRVIVTAGVAESVDEVRVARGAEPLSLRQKWHHGAWHLRQVRNVPLGVLYVETFEKAVAREAQRP